MLYLTRTSKGLDGIFGTIDIAGQIIAVTLEHSYPNGDSFAPKIPEGVFQCVRGLHRLEGMTHDFETFEIQVPGHTGILFHPGNFNKDSSGCVLLGSSLFYYSPHCRILKDSDIAFTKFMQCLDKINDISLTVQNMY